MRKNLFTGMAAILFCGVFTSCSHDMDVDTSAFEQSIQIRHGASVLQARLAPVLPTMRPHPLT